MKPSLGALLGAAILSISAPAIAETLTIATVNNGDMIRMQGLTNDFTAKNPDITVKWVTLEENVLRQRVTTDIATKGGQFDVLTIGTYEVPIWAKKGWLVPLDNLGADYDVADLLPKIRDAVSVDGKLYAAPFYGESSMIMYRTDLFQKAGLTMPEKPTWDFVIDAAKKLTDKSAGVYGICLRGKAGWGENMAFLTRDGQFLRRALVRREMATAVRQAGMEEDAHDLCRPDEGGGPAGRQLQRLQREPRPVQCRQVRDVDRCHGRGLLRDQSQGFEGGRQGRLRLAPNAGLGKNANWLWAWNLAIPAGSKKVPAAEKFIGWATSKDYAKLVAAKDGWANVPPGTRTSLYQNPEYLKVAPFAKPTLASIDAADPNKPTVQPVPYVGVQYAAIPEFQGIGTAVGQQFSAALSGASTVDAALAAAQSSTEREMKRAGYIK